jgi:integrase/recombinase XerD
MLRTAPVERAGAGRGRARSPGRINQILAAVRELYKHAVANDGLDAGVLAFLYEVGDDRYLPADLRPEGSGLRYVARPRHVQRARRRATPDSVRAGEIEALLRAVSNWRDRFLLVLLWFCGLRIGEALGLRRSDLHFVPASAALGCSIPGPHLHVAGRDNPNRARAKSGGRHVPVRAEVLSCYDRYLGERAACPPAEVCDFVLVNLFHEPLGRPMSDHTVRQWLAALSERAGLDRTVRPLSRPGARFRCCHRPVSPDRSPNPPCRSPGNGLSTAAAIRRGSQVATGLGSCSPGRRSGRPSRPGAGSTRPRPPRSATARQRR